MANDVIAMLVRLSVVGSLGILLVGVLRAPARHTVGAEAAYSLWLLVPASLIAVLLPRAPSCLCGPESYVSPLVIRGIGEPLALAPHMEVSPHAVTLIVAWGIGAIAAAVYFGCWQHVLRSSLGPLQRRPDGAYSSPTAKQPMLVGAWRPKIVLPSDFDSRYSEHERTVILAHERAHVRRHDALTNGIALALVCLSWFSPLAYWAWSRFRFDQELACDAAVLRRAGVSRRRYAHALARTELVTLIAVGFGWRRRHPLIERVAMLRRRPPGRTRRLFGHALALVLMLSGTYVVWAAQPEEAPATASLGSSAQGTPRETSGVDSYSVRVFGQSITVEKNRIAGPQLRMILAPQVPIYFQADSVSVPKDGGWTLEGHVRIAAGVTRMVHAGPDVLTNGVRPVIATAERAVIAPQRNGGFEVSIEKGSVQF
jgi:bla regulator protein blaR1